MLTGALFWTVKKHQDCEHSVLLLKCQLYQRSHQSKTPRAETLKLSSMDGSHLSCPQACLQLTPIQFILRQHFTAKKHPSTHTRPSDFPSPASESWTGFTSSPAEDMGGSGLQCKQDLNPSIPALPIGFLQYDGVCLFPKQTELSYLLQILCC